MTLSKNQQDDESKIKYNKFFWIWERDLLALAGRYPDWRDKANSLGFTDEKIAAPWPHKDVGRHIKYMQNPWWSETPRP